MKGTAIRNGKKREPRKHQMLDGKNDSKFTENGGVRLSSSVLDTDSSTQSVGTRGFESHFSDFYLRDVVLKAKRWVGDSVLGSRNSPSRPI